jgi:hypothetical protein
MKIGIVITMHWSTEFRPKGEFYIKNIIKSIEDNITFDYTIYVIDNGSEFQIDLSKYKNLVYIKIEDQTIEGIVGAWNRGICHAYQDGCDIIVNSNDDLVLNKDVNKFIDYIINDPEKDNCVYGPRPDAGQPLDDRIIKYPTQGVEIRNVVNGFFFAFSRNHYEKYRFLPEKYFNTDNKYSSDKTIWAGQEGQFLENCEKGCKCKLINFCWINHIKERGWKKTKRKYNT